MVKRRKSRGAWVRWLVAGVAALAIVFVPLVLPKGGSDSISGPMKALSLSRAAYVAGDKKTMTAADEALCNVVAQGGCNTLLADVDPAQDLEAFQLLCKAARGTGVQVLGVLEAQADTAAVKTLVKKCAAGGYVVRCAGAGAGEDVLEAIIDAAGKAEAVYAMAATADALPTAVQGEGVNGVFLPAGAAGGFGVYATTGVGLYCYADEDKTAYSAALFSVMGRPGAEGEAFSGAVLGSYPDALQDGEAAFLLTLFTDVYKADNFTMPTALAVNYPANNSYTTDATVALTGTAAPGVPVYVDDEEVTDRGADGSFVAPSSLVVGKNIFTVTQGDTTVKITVTRQRVTGTTASTLPATLTPVKQGTAVRVTEQLGALLEDEDDNDTIVCSVPAGTEITVKGIVKTVRSGRYTYAYKTASGQYILGATVEEAEPRADIVTAANIEALENGREALTLTGIRSLAVPEKTGDKTMVLHIYDMSVSDPALFEGLSGRFIQSVLAEKTDDGWDLTLQFSKKLWGWTTAVEAEGDSAALTLFCVPAPALSDDPARPLAGVTVLVDPGHGGNDSGALGLGGGIGGPMEKELNLALGKAIRARLEQLGATVVMTRTDDTAVSLEDRLARTNTILPDFFLAVHHNSTALLKETTENNQVETYFWEEGSRRFAGLVGEAVSAATGRTVDEAAPYRFYVTRTTACPAILAEYGYLVNTAQYSQCYSADGILRGADGTARAILQAVTQAE